MSGSINGRYVALRLVLAFTVLAAFFMSDVEARIIKQAIPGKSGICLYSWPELAQVDGWYQDQDSSLHYNHNSLAPVGSTFRDAETVMYAAAIYKPRIPEAKTLEMYITIDKEKFGNPSNMPDVADAESLVTADGRTLRSVTFFPRDKGNWERVTYAEEGDYYLIFSLSSRSRAGYEKATKDYEQMVRSYKEGEKEPKPGQ